MLWHRNALQDDECLIVEMLQELQREVPVMGTKKIYQILKPTLEAHQIKIGWNRLHEIRVRYQLTHVRRRRYITTTYSKHRFRKYPNIIKELEVRQPEQLWVSDITYITVGNAFHFLSLVTDAYSRFIVGYCLYPTLAAKGPMAALEMAISSLSGDVYGLIHHSDRGVQYCCDAYVERLQDKGIAISMTENGDPYQNAIAERINGILKENYNLKQVFADAKEAKQAIQRAVYSYNYRRPHSSLDNQTPALAHQLAGFIARKWKPKVYKKGVISHDPSLHI
jgi:transposase InsO family protein